MSQNTKTIYETNRSLIEELLPIFPANEANSICKIILEYIGFPEFSILKDPLQLVSNKNQSEIKKIVNELKKNKPIQYILGETYFYDLKIIVNENVLIPRPETEELISKILLEQEKSLVNILDIGTGSGCIAVALAKNLSDSKVFALDIDQKALNLAKTNADENEVSITFIHESLFNMKTQPENVKFDLIVSNPPYVTNSDKLQMDKNVLDFEPALALFVKDEDPLIFYKEIIRYASSKLNESGKIWMEINEKFGAETKQLFFNAGYKNVRLLKDIHGKDRFLNVIKQND